MPLIFSTCWGYVIGVFVTIRKAPVRDSLQSPNYLNSYLQQEWYRDRPKPLQKRRTFAVLRGPFSETRGKRNSRRWCLLLYCSSNEVMKHIVLRKDPELALKLNQYQECLAIFFWLSHFLCKGRAMGDRENTRHQSHAPQPDDQRHSKTAAEQRVEQRSVLSYLSDFGDYSSAHGVGRIRSSKRLVGKVLWSLLFVGAVGMLLFQVHLLSKKFQERPLNTFIRLEHETVSRTLTCRASTCECFHWRTGSTLSGKSIRQGWIFGQLTNSPLVAEFSPAFTQLHRKIGEGNLKKIGNDQFTVCRTWLFIAYSYERWLIYQLS